MPSKGRLNKLVPGNLDVFLISRLYAFQNPIVNIDFDLFVIYLRTGVGRGQVCDIFADWRAKGTRNAPPPHLVGPFL